MQAQALLYFSGNPQRLFLLDALGAALSGLLLMVVLPGFPEYFRMPASILEILGAIAFGLCGYSTICFFMSKQNAGRMLRILAVSNSLYSLLSLGLLWNYRAELSLLDVGYFIGECLLLWFLVSLEWSVSNRLR